MKYLLVSKRIIVLFILFIPLVVFTQDESKRQTAISFVNAVNDKRFVEAESLTIDSFIKTLHLIFALFLEFKFFYIEGIHFYYKAIIQCNQNDKNVLYHKLMVIHNLILLRMFPYK